MKREHPNRLPDTRLVARAARRARRLLGRPPFDFDDIGERLVMGAHSYARPRVRWYWGDNASVHVGRYTSIADDVELMVGGVHPTGWVSTFAFRARFGLDGRYVDGIPQPARDIEIGSDVYIGAGACVLAGVRIGDGAVIGAHAVVARDVRPYAVVVGNPAREVKRRFDDDQVARLLELRWWDWPDAKVQEAVPLLSSDRIDEFLEQYA